MAGYLSRTIDLLGWGLVVSKTPGSCLNSWMPWGVDVLKQYRVSNNSGGLLRGLAVSEVMDFLHQVITVPLMWVPPGRLLGAWWVSSGCLLRARCAPDASGRLPNVSRCLQMLYGSCQMPKMPPDVSQMRLDSSLFPLCILLRTLIFYSICALLLLFAPLYFLLSTLCSLRFTPHALPFIAYYSLFILCS